MFLPTFQVSAVGEGRRGYVASLGTALAGQDSGKESRHGNPRLVTALLGIVGAIVGGYPGRAIG
jgi:hypothetical protein